MIDYVEVAEKAVDIITNAEAAIVITTRGVIIEGSADRLVPMLSSLIVKSDDLQAILASANMLIYDITKSLILKSEEK